MSTLSELLNLAPIETPEEAIYARPLQELGAQLHGVQIPYRGVDLSGGERFLLEMGKGFGGTLSQLLGAELASQAQNKISAQRYGLAQELLAKDAQRSLELEKAKQKEFLTKAAIDSGMLTVGLDESGSPTLVKGEGSDSSSSYENLDLTDAQKSALRVLPQKLKNEKLSYFIAENERQNRIDKRLAQTGKKDWWGILGIDQKNQALEAPKVAKEGLKLAQDLETLIPKYNAITWGVSKPISGTDAQRMNTELAFWAQKATRLVDKGALTEGDKKTLQEIATGKGTLLSRPSTLAPFIERINKNLISGTVNQLKAARTAYEKGGDALLDELGAFTGEKALPVFGIKESMGMPVDLGRKSPPPNMSFEEFVAWKKQNGK